MIPLHRSALILLCALAAADVRADDPPPLTTEELSASTTHFELVDGELRGPGADLLRDELGRHGVIVLGEYHGSRRTSEFVRALIPGLHEAGFRHLALEVGPTAARVLRDLADDGTGTVEALRDFHTRYTIERAGRPRPAIPFVTGISDAHFLAEAARAGWSWFGVDQEFIYGLLPLVDHVVPRLRAAGVDSGSVAVRARAAVRRIHAADGDDDPNPAIALESSAEIQAFLDLVARADSTGRRFADDVRESLAIYRLNAEGDWWNSNGRRIAHMKGNLRRGLGEQDFDPRNDRLLLKIGGVHAGRGLSLLRHYEIGNTLSELMELHGRTSLHVICGSRFWIEDGDVVDGLESDRRYELVRSLGERDRWTIVDLRPSRRAILYDRFSLERFLKEWFTQFDLVVIPPADETVRPNRD